MPKICYKQKRFTNNSLVVIAQANSIIEEYSAQGFKLTLRQLYYQFVARDLIENSQRSYNRIGSIITDARNAGMVDWEAIEDRTRNVIKEAHWDHPSEILEACAQQFRFDLWENQQYRPEVWIEKDALIGVFGGICKDLDVPLFSCRGYTSLSEVWCAGRRFREHFLNAQIPVILHFGDHDPSGIDMTRDICDRLALYSEDDVEINRLALTMDQIDEHQPPPNPAKMTDTRYIKYVSVYGNECWELDALEPSMLFNLVNETVVQYRNDAIWFRDVARQDKVRKQLRIVADEWDDK